MHFEPDPFLSAWSDTDRRRPGLKVLLPDGDSIQVLALPHGHPVAIVDINDDILRAQLDKFATANKMTRDQAVLQLVIDRLTQIDYEKKGRRDHHD